MRKQSFLIRQRLLSFKYAFEGLRVLAKQPNVRIQLVAATIVLIMAWQFKIDTTECCLIFLCIGIVLAFEGINTSIENLADVVSPEKNQQIKIVKDVGAGAVLIASIVSLAIGFVIFLPRILNQVT